MLTPLLLLLLVIAVVILLPIGLCGALSVHVKEKHRRSQLVAAGRWLEWEAVEAKLQHGEGTHIIEHCSPSGPLREWWTEDDVIAGAPVPLPASVKMYQESESHLQALQEYSKQCADRHLTIETGTAKLTEVPGSLGQRLNPNKYITVDLGDGLITAVMLVSGRKLAQTYPHAKIVSLVNWADAPALFTGDAESVFLGYSSDS